VNPYLVYLILSFASSLIFSLIFTVNLLYHVTVVELSPLQLVLVGTILETSVFLFEVPTGIVADVKMRIPMKTTTCSGHAVHLSERSDASEIIIPSSGRHGQGRIDFAP
jgi:hypothetical protein